MLCKLDGDADAEATVENIEYVRWDSVVRDVIGSCRCWRTRKRGWYAAQSLIMGASFSSDAADVRGTIHRYVCMKVDEALGTQDSSQVQVGEPP